MFEIAKKGREDNKSKARRMALGHPNEKVDASDFMPYKNKDFNKQTGAIPISKPAFKKGGKVISAAMGEKSEHRCDRKPRASGGNAKATPNNLINRNVKSANEERGGITHVGGFKKGGKIHDDAAEDKKMIKGMVKPEALKRMARKSGGRTKGKTNINIIIGTSPKGEAPLGSGMMPNAPVKPPVMPMVPPPAAGPPMGAMPPGLPPGGLPAGLPPMARKSGGRASKPIHVIDNAAGGGLGRLEKIKAYGLKLRKLSKGK